MDQKTWIWTKRLPVKTILASGRTDIPLKGNEEELLSNEKEVALQESMEVLNEKLASVLSELNAKDELVADHLRKAEAALAGKEKAEAEVLHLKEELSKALRERAAENERTGHLNAALKDCMQQLNSVREEQEQRVHDAVIATSKELDKAHKKLEERLTMMSKKLTNLTTENSHLNKALIERDMLIEGLSKFKTQAEAELNTLTARLDTTEKENAFLRYEFRMLEKELDIRNEDRKFTCYSLDASHKQYMESVKKIKKLEAECQRLRVLVRKRLPGPAALAKMTREVDIRSGYQTQTRTRKPNSVTGVLVVRDSPMEPLPDTTSSNVSFLVERLRDIEEENKVLKEILMHRDSDVSSLKLGVPKPPSVSSSLSELELLKHGDVKDKSETKMLGISDMSLMDDFVEMEKLAIVSVDSELQSTCSTPNSKGSIVTSLTTAERPSSCKELVPVGQSELSNKDQQHQTRDFSTRSSYDWLQHVLNVILEQNHVSGVKLEELLEDISTALQNMNPMCSSGDSKAVISKDPVTEKLPISSLITWKCHVIPPRATSTNEIPDNGKLMEKGRNEVERSNLGRSISKIIGLVRELDPNFPADGMRSEHSTLQSEQPITSVDYVIHAFRWKRCDFAAVLQEFVETCNDILDGKSNFEKFAEVLASELSWIINSCVAKGGASGSRDENSGPLNETGSRISENIAIELEKVNYVLQVENEGLKAELNAEKSSRQDMETRLQAANDKNTSLTNELQQSQQSIGSLQAELESLRGSKRMTEDQIENQKSINEDLDTQLTVSKSKLNEALQKLSSLEVEFENKSTCCEELELTCLELQLQLESINTTETQKVSRDQGDRMLQNGWELNAASAKLDECQETILKLGKQLKALATSKEALSAEKVLSTSSTYANQKLNRRLSLLDRMQFDDSAEQVDDMKSPTTKESISTTRTNKSLILHADSCRSLCLPDAPAETPNVHFRLRREASKTHVGALAIVPSKKRGGGISFLKKLIFRKNGSKKKPSFYLSA